jgi:WD40 repeat protein/Tfp pilus assembly protein PilF
MADSVPAAPTSPDPLEAALAEYLQAEEEGNAPNEEAFLAGHPEVADQLRSFFAAHHRVKPLLPATPLSTGPYMPGAATPADAELADKLPLRLREPSHSDPPPLKPLPDHMPAEIGRYRLFGQLGRGGMGAVYQGQDTVLGRDLAIKVLLPEHSGDTALQQRFFEEAQVGGQLQHPGIVPVYDLGTWQERLPFFSMKLVEGRTLADLLKERTTPPQDLPRFLKVFEQICQTLAYAHDRGVIHRDLKPGNIMVGAFGEVQVMDWGLAKVLSSRPQDRPKAAESTQPSDAPVPDSTTMPTTVVAPGVVSDSRTRAGQAVGTPPYMPPEQARGEIDKLDERSDVFGLGAILCEILTGAPPYRGQSRQEIFDKARAGDLADAMTRLESCGAELDLLTLTKQCLAAEPAARPATAKAVADAMTAYLAGVQERLQQTELARAAAQAKAVEERKRRRLTMVSAGVVLATMAIAFLLINNARQAAVALAGENEQLALRERDQRGKAEQLAGEKTTLAEKNARLATEERKNRQQMQEQVLRMTLSEGFQRDRRGDATGGLLWQLRALKMTAGNEFPTWQQAIRASLGAWRHQVITLRSPLRHTVTVLAVAYRPDGKVILTGTRDGTARLWDVATGQPLVPPLKQRGEITAVAFSTDSTLCATASDQVLCLWNATNGQPVGAPRPLSGKVRRVAFTPASAGRKPALLVATSRSLHRWDLASGQEQFPAITWKGETAVAVFSTDGRLALTGQDVDTQGQVWDLLAGKALGPPLVHPTGSFYSASFAPDNCMVWTRGLTDSFVRGWEVKTGRLVVPEGPLEVLEEGSLAGAGGRWALRFDETEKKAQVWDRRQRRALSPPLPYQGNWLVTTSFSPDGRLVAFATGMGGHDGWHQPGYVWVYEIATGERVGQPIPHRSPPLHVAFGPEGRTLLTATGSPGRIYNNPAMEDRTAWLWELPDPGRGLILQPAGAPAQCMAISPDGQRLIAGSANGGVHVWERTTGEEAEPLPRHRGIVTGVAVAPQGQRGASTSVDQTARLWDTTTGQPVGEPLPHSGRVYFLRFSPDGKLLATVCNAPFIREEKGAGEVRLWDAQTGKPFGAPLAHPVRILCLAFSPDSRILVTGAEDGSLRRWEVATGKVLGVPGKQSGAVTDLVFHPRRGIFVSASANHFAQRWSATSGRALGKPLQHHGAVSGVAFNPQGDCLLTSSHDGTVILWRGDGETLQETRMDVESSVQDAAFSPDGRLVATCGSQGQIQLWDAAMGWPVGSPRQHPKARRVYFFPDGKELVSMGDEVRLWNVPVPLSGTPEQLQLWGELVTLRQLGPDLVVRYQDSDFWAEQRQALEKAGGWPIPPENLSFWHQHEAALAEQRGQWFTASWHLTRLLAKEPNSWRLRHRRAIAQSEEGNVAGAIADWSEALRLKPDLLEARFNRGLTYYQLGRWTEALTDLTETVRAEPELNAAWRYRGLVHGELGQWDRALEDLRRSVEQGRTSALAVAELALVCQHTGRVEEYQKWCRFVWEDVDKKRPGEVPGETLAALAWACLVVPEPPVDPKRLVAALRQALRGRPRNYLVARALGAALVRAGQYEAAIAQLEQAGELRPEGAPWVWTWAAIAHHRLGKKEAANQALRKVTAWIKQAQQSNEGQESTWQRLPWTERVVLEALHREATQLIQPPKEEKAPAGLPPQNIFPFPRKNPPLFPL